MEEIATTSAPLATEPFDYNKPYFITDDLADFIKVDRGSKMSKNAVVELITAYIKENGFEINHEEYYRGTSTILVYNYNSDKQYTIDNDLTKLLGIYNEDESGNPMNYTNLPIYLNKHFYMEETKFDETKTILITDELADFLKIESGTRMTMENIHDIVTAYHDTWHYPKRPIDKQQIPTGFCRPRLITDELADFLNVEHGTEMSRPDVSKHITAYIKENKLDKGRFIFPDEVLKKLLKYSDEDNGPKPMTYLNFLYYIKHLFIK